MSRIFISYAHKDAGIAQSITRRLEGLGYRVWMDEALIADRRWEEAVRAEVKESDAFIVILSDHANRSRWVEYESALAMRSGKDKLILPVLIGEKSKTNSIWPLVADRQALDAGDTFDDHDLELLASTIQKKVA